MKKTHRNKGAMPPALLLLEAAMLLGLVACGVVLCNVSRLWCGFV